jgi:YD repeat-containing protein
MADRDKGLEVTYQYEACDAPMASAPVEWMRLVGSILTSAPLAIAATPLAQSAGALSMLHRTSPAPVPGDRRAMLGSAAGVRLKSITLPDGSRVVRSYDSAGRLSSVTFPDGQMVQYREQGSTVTVSPGGSWRVVCRHDAMGRLSRVEYGPSTPQGASFTYRWGPQGLLAGIGFPDSVWLGYRWDGLGHLVEAGDGRASISYQWGKAQNLVGIRCSEGQQEVSLKLPSGEASVVWQKREEGSTARTVCPLGIFTAGAGGRVLSLLRLNGNRVTWAHDAAGRVIRVSTGAGATVISCAPGGQPTSLVQPHGARFCWRPLGDGRTAFLVGDSSVARVKRDGRGRLTEVRDAAGFAVRYSYRAWQAGDDPSSVASSQWGRLLLRYHSGRRLQSVELEGRGKCSFSYGPDGRLAGMALRSASVHMLELAGVAAWCYALSSVGPGALADSFEWAHLVR